MKRCVSMISNLLKKKSPYKTLFVIDEHRALFNTEIPVPDHLHSLQFLKNLTFWDESMNGTCVILTGTAHARYEKVYLKNGMQDWIIFIGTLSQEIFDQLLTTVLFHFNPTIHDHILDIKKEVLRITNCVPRELIILSKSIG